MQTFIVEKFDDGTKKLCAIDGKQNVTVLATFKDSVAIGIFWETFNLAKAASHEHGRNGI